MGLHLTRREAFGGERDDHRVDPTQPALAFTYRLRLEAAVPIPRHLDVDRADLGEHPLRAGTVARVAEVTALHGVLDVAEMLIHLDLQPSLEDLLRQPGQQPARADQPDAVGAR